MPNDNYRFSKVVVLYSSGTGNSYLASLWMKEIAADYAPIVIHKSIDGLDLKEVFPIGKSDLLAFYYPTHGFTAPWHIIKFAIKIPRSLGTSAVCIPTRASVKFGNFISPGLSGSAAFIIYLVLILKSFAIKGFTALDMPSNWFSLHPIQSVESHKKVIARAKRLHHSFAKIILSGGRKWLSLNLIYEAFFGLALFPISILYLFVGRIFLAKLFFANKNCNSCGLCAEHCPIGAVKMVGKKNAKPYWSYNCESCMRCAGFCPHNAIEAGHSWAAILIYVASIPISFLVFSTIGGNLLILDFQGTLLGTFINTIYTYLSLITSYAIYHYLIRIPLVNRIFSVTTFTHYWGRYKAPEVKINHLSNKAD